MSFRPQLLLTRFDGGANTHDFSDNIGRNQSPNPRGIELKGSSIRKARGYTEVGTEPSPTDIGFTLHNHRILSSTELLIKTIGTTIKFLDPVTDIWYPITSATFTANKRWWFDSFNGYMYGGNGTDNFVRWRASAYSTLNGAVLSGAATIDLATGTGSKFPATGSGMIEGDTFSWTGVSSDQLTGVSGLGSNHASGSTVVIEVDASTYSSAPKGSVGLIFKNRTFVRDDASPNFWYFSKLADNTDPHDDLANFSIAGSGTGDAGYIILPAPIIGARVFITGGNDAVQVVICADGIAYAASVTDTGGATVGIAVPFKVLGADLAGQRMMAITENDLVVMDGFGNLRALGYGEQSTTLKTARLSDNVDATLETIDFSGGAMEYFNRNLYTLGKQNDSDSNNFAVVKFTNPDGFAFFDHWAFNDIIEHSNRLYGLSSLTGRVFLLNNGFNADGNNIASSFPLPALDFGAPLILKQVLQIRIAGYITNNCNLYIKLYFDDSTTPMTFLIDGDNGDITSALDNVSVGTVVFGQGVEGGGLPEGVVRKRFRATLIVNDLTWFYLLNVVFENNQSDVDFALDKMLFWAEVVDADVTEKDAVNIEAS